MRVEGVALEDHADAAVLRMEMIHAPVPEDDRAGRRPVDPRDHEQRRGFPAARRPEKGDELARPHLEVEILHGRDGAETFREPLERDPHG